MYAAWFRVSPFLHSVRDQGGDRLQLAHLVDPPESSNGFPASPKWPPLLEKGAWFLRRVMVSASAMTTSQNSSGNPILDNPALSAVVFAIVVLCGFMGALYNVATSHHPHAGGHHAPAGAAKH